MTDLNKAIESLEEATKAVHAAGCAVDLNDLIKRFEVLLEEGKIVRWEILATRHGWNFCCAYPTPWDDRPVNEGGRSAAIHRESLLRDQPEQEIIEDFFNDLTLLLKPTDGTT